MRVISIPRVLSIFFIFALVLSFERRAYAYVDPGSGLVVLQGIGTFLAGVSFYFRRNLKRLLFRNAPPPRQKSSDRCEPV